MMDPDLILIFAIAGACFGFLVGYILRGFFRRSEKSDVNFAVETEPEEITPPQKVASDPNWSEVALLWRDRSNGHFIFQVGNRNFKPGDEVSEKERNALLKIFRDFYLWLEPASSAQSEKMTAASEYPKASRRLDATPNGPSNGNSPKVSLNPANMISNALRADVPVATSPSQNNMVAQVDEILQEKLIRENMQKWAIRLAEFPNKGMVVLVGLEQYEGIDEVPYERVRQVIRESVKEWERRVDALVASQEAQQYQF